MGRYVIIAATNESEGRRTSVSIDPLMFNCFALLVGSDKKARLEVRDYVKNAYRVPSSRDVQNFIFRRCCRPSLIDKYDNYEGQFDIEDF